MFENNLSPKKSEKTKENLYQAAMKLFREVGFERANMRAIAKEAGIAVGSSYYYYESKEALVYEYYQRLHTDHLESLGGFLAKEKSFAKRLHEVMRSKIEVALPNKDMARALYRVAAHPESPLSPFSDENEKLRLESLKIFQEVVNGSADSFHPELKKLLPEYLWLYQMGVILFWIYDSSPKSKRTFDFIDKTVPLIVFFNKQIQSPLAIAVRGKIISTLKSFSPDLGKVQMLAKEDL